MGKYRVLGSFLDRVFRNNLNSNFDDIDTDIQAQKQRVDDLIIANPSPSEVQDARLGFPVLRDKLLDVDTQLAEIVYNVKSFGAKGDGSTDDTASIRQAVEEARLVGGSVKLFFPRSSGAYMVSNVIYLVSNMTVEFEQGAEIHAFDNGSTFDALSIFRAQRDNCVLGEAYDGLHKNIIIRNAKVKGPLDTNRPRGGSAIHFGYIEGVRVENCEVIQASDAGIRVEGYGAGTFVDDPTSPFWANSKDIWIQNNRVSNSFLGIELEGGATDARIFGNKVYNTTSHAIRFPSAYGVTATDNIMENIGECGFYIDRCKDIVVSNNIIEAGNGIAVNLAEGETVSVMNNLIRKGGIRDNYTGNSTKYITNLIINGNQILENADQRIQIHYSKNVLIENNYANGNIELKSDGNMRNNRAVIRNDSTYSYTKARGGKVIYQGNINITDGNIDRPEVQGGLIGAASGIPTSGTYKVGHWIQNSTPTNGGKFGWVCTRAGERQPDWQASTSYTVGQRIYASGYIYECTVAGTSGTSAPTHTSGTATNGTATFQYISQAALFRAFGLID